MNVTTANSTIAGTKGKGSTSALVAASRASLPSILASGATVIAVEPVPQMLAKLAAGEADAILLAYAGLRRLGLGKLAQPLRAALTGQTTSPGIFDVLVLLGRDESLARIADQTNAATATQV